MLRCIIIIVGDGLGVMEAGSDGRFENILIWEMKGLLCRSTSGLKEVC